MRAPFALLLLGVCGACDHAPQPIVAVAAPVPANHAAPAAQAPAIEASSIAAPAAQAPAADALAAPADEPDEVRLRGGRLRTTPQAEPFALDTSRPFELWLGTGSGRDGLDIVKLMPDGTVTTYGVAGRSPRGGTLHPTSVELDALRAQVRAANVPAMAARYSAGVWDGSQQLLYITQDGHERVVYCDNAVPTRFAALRDALRAFVSAHRLSAPWTTNAQWDRANAALWAKLGP